MLYLPTRVAFLCFLALLLIFLFGPPCVAETVPHGCIGKLHVLWLWVRLCDCVLPDWIWVDVTCIISRPGLLNPTRSLLLSLLLNVELPAEDREVQTERESGSRTNWMKHPHPPNRPIALGMKETCYFIMLNNWDLGIITAAPITYPDTCTWCGIQACRKASLSYGFDPNCNLDVWVSVFLRQQSA